MKRFFRFCAGLAAVLLLTAACTKEGAPRFKGNYTFKTSGTVTVRPADDAEAEQTVISLMDENGQLDVVTVDKSSGEMMVAMNIVGGSVLTFNAVADGRTLTLTPFTRRLQIPVVSGNPIDTALPEATVTVSGYAERYTDALLFWISYEGTYTYDGVEYEITDSNISCWAKEN